MTRGEHIVPKHRALPSGIKWELFESLAMRCKRANKVSADLQSRIWTVALRLIRGARRT